MAASTTNDQQDATAQRVQAWKRVWPPTESVKPAAEKAPKGQMKNLGETGGAYPNYIKPTEGVRL